MEFFVVRVNAIITDKIGKKGILASPVFIYAYGKMIRNRFRDTFIFYWFASSQIMNRYRHTTPQLYLDVF
ncbi:MAG: hypothetical protein CXR30_06950 [Geobacter sp.]|nr:MAG: hypothetical protein CXR30_06950 [Geobacter sp.]